MEPLLNNMIKAFGWSIFHSLWQGAIVYGLLFTAIMFIPRFTAQTKHNMAFGSICLTFLSFCITFWTTFEMPGSTSGKVDQHPVSLIFNNYAPSLTERIGEQAERFFPILVTLYGIGLIMQIVILLNGYSKLNALKKSAKTAVPISWMDIFNSTKARLHIRKKVSFFLSDQVNVPLVLGFLKPVVLFPVALANNLDLNQVEAILIHELSHIRRNDYLLNLVKTAIETILFFNPFIWLSGRFIQIEREHACDDLVVAITGTPVTYAHALLKLELLQEKSSPALALAATGKHQYLYQRIKRITNMKANYMNVRQQILLITVTFSTIISLAWINPDQSKAAVKTLVANVVKKIDVFESHPTVEKQNVPVADRKAQPILSDTTKKKAKIKITIEDPKGVQTTYNSIEEIPDSLKITSIGGKGFILQGKSLLGPDFKGIRDTAFLTGLSIDSKKLLKELNMPELQIKARAMGLEMGKTAEAFAKKFNTPEEKAKWVKLRAELQKNNEAFIKKFNSPEEKARLSELFRNLPGTKTESLFSIIDGTPITMSALNSVLIDSNKNAIIKLKGKSYDDELKLVMTPEYQELRKKFQAEVEELRKKKGLGSTKK
ncbi:M56 family metallopeptidase [Pedobacter duraquae]|uniref:BlaR1 peptidase M56 n=1 Tax=Pedobacter duraquae TaxID=425511 RepID=A0A4R6IJB4_9SPHI|nr:M56 family metallopeptidase [Pedobacter duraquae]TDO22081.1 BlaR1 peptidase M56 [Pedobacter duraquae]